MENFNSSQKVLREKNEADGRLQFKVAMVEEGDEDEQFKAVMDEAKQALQVSSIAT